MGGMYSKFDGIGDDDDDNRAAAVPPAPSVSREDTIKKLENMQALGKDASIAELMAQMRAPAELPTSAKQQLMEKLGPLAESLQPKSTQPPQSGTSVAAETASAFASALASDKSAFGLPKAVQREQEKREDEERRALIGTKVIVSGLTGRPKLNGHCGEVTAWNAAKGRFAVKLATLSDPILLKPINIVTPDKLMTQSVEGPPKASEES